MSTDKAGKEYWDNLFSENKLPDAIAPHMPGLHNYTNRRFHQYFSRIFSSTETRDKKLLEIGCAQSQWLPYFATEYGFRVYGIDYSAKGCQKARDVLFNAGVDGEIECVDFFSSPKAMLNSFDVVVSFGVAEHFEDTASCIKKFSDYLRPDGIMITIIPNLSGLPGLIQKLLNRPVFDKHKLLHTEDMRKAHEAAGLRVSACDYFIFSNFGVLNLNGIPSGTIEHAIKKIFFKLLTYFSYIIWFIESKAGLIKGYKTFSAYIVCKSSLPSNKKDGGNE